ncbi:hypothetical protein N9N67_00735 [Bacteriovoracaceae bacterium]|nr:hypothetical protein [Bacteriovoracaceae bacterium]
MKKIFFLLVVFSFIAVSCGPKASGKGGDTGTIMATVEVEGSGGN